MRTAAIVIVLHPLLVAEPPVVFAAPEPATRTFRVEEPIFQGSAFITESGAGNPVSVILIHGVGEDLCARSWDFLVPELSKKYHVITFDLPGFCRSSKDNTLYSPTRYAAFVKWVADRYARGRYIVIGHSMGGAIALRFAATYPDDLRRLVLIDAAGILHRATFTKYALGQKLKPESFPLGKWGVDFVGSLMGSVVDRVEGNSNGEMNLLLNNSALRQGVLKGDPVRIASMALMQEDFSEALERVTVPTLVVWGEKDDIAPLRTGKVLKARIPGARLAVIPGAGHTPMLTHGEQFNRLVLDDLAQAVTGKTAEERPVPATANAPEGTCRDQEEMTFTGTYRSIIITNCSKVNIRGAVTRKLELVGSKEVSIENSRIDAEGVAMKIEKSEAALTDVSITGDVAISAADGALDLAGVSLVGKTAAVKASGNSSLIFSVSTVKSPHSTGHLHGLYRPTPDHPL